jgi:predicted Kef-type K+ transport protein
MDPLLISAAFAFGFVAHRIGLPPLVGFLLAGLVLNAFGVASTSMLAFISDIGVTLLLFTIGLKLKIKSLLRPEVWAGTSIYMVLTVALFGFMLFGLAHSGLHFFLGLDLTKSLLLAFALSFSSTVFAVKILEESGRVNSLNGRTAIGILIVQDLLAVIYLTLSTGEIPSWWALAVIAALPLARKAFMFLMDLVGHGELMPLFGLVLALGAGAAIFDLVGMKADLGALVLGVLIAPHPRAKELADQLMGIKDVLLVGFFLKIGLIGLPNLSGLIAAGILVLALPLKLAVYYVVLTRFRLKARTSFVTTMNLANYSEFGLIVCSLAVSAGHIDQTWLVVLAVALSASFVIASPLNKFADRILEGVCGGIKVLETKTRHPEEIPYGRGPWRAIVIGMGRAGVGAYDMLHEKLEGFVLGIDYNPEKVKRHSSAGRNMLITDVTDPDFWQRLPVPDGVVQMIVLAIPNLDAMLLVNQKLQETGYQGQVAALARYDDEVEALNKAGLDFAFHIYREAGAGLAAEMTDSLKELKE